MKWLAFFRRKPPAIEVAPQPPLRRGTAICRCEGVTWLEIRQLLQEGRVPAEVKRATRVGMGRCQARMCEHIIIGMYHEAQQERLAFQASVLDLLRAMQCQLRYPPSVLRQLTEEALRVFEQPPSTDQEAGLPQ